MDEKQINNLFKDVYSGSETDIEIFKIWVETRHITKFVKSHPNWRNVTRNGMRGQRSIPCSDDIGRLSLMDHIGLWQDEYGRKVFISQPYVDENSSNMFKEQYSELIQFCEIRNLEVKVFPTEESFYYPGRTILIEIREEIN